MKKAILAVAATLFVLPALSFAGIQYIDLQGVTTHSSEYWDLDSDGTHDIGVVWSYDEWDGSTTASAAIPFGGNDENGFAALGVLAEKMAAGDEVSGGLTFKKDTTLLSEYWDDDGWAYATWGNWDNMGENESAFLGFRFLDSDSQFHYGWIRARVNPSNQYITLYDMAWETTAHKAITAGDAGSPVPVPGGVWLLGSGLAGLAAWGRKYR